jgi:DNA-binding NarL/FixJ family response regulator
MVIISARDSGEVDREIARLYLEGKNVQEIGLAIDLGPSSVGVRIRKMVKWEELRRR